MKPLEVMAKAAYDEFVGPMRAVEPAWESLPDSHRNRLEESMRAALLARAEIKLPLHALNAAQEAVSNCLASEFMDVAFEAICRSLAEEKTE